MGFDDSGKGALLLLQTIAQKEGIMLYTIAAVLIALWLVGLLTSFTVGGFIHILLVVAVIVVLVRLIQGRRLA
jgi:hypothetical protein